MAAMTMTKPYKGLAMEGAIARWYARNTARDARRFDAAARIVAERTRTGAAVLEVAPGPGYLAIEIARSGRKVTGLDISESFVAIARRNADQAGVTAEFQRGNASAMPFAGDAFDFVICMAAFKNFANPLGALNEIHRVLKPGGEASILDLRKDASLEEINTEIAGMRLSAWNSLMTRWIFRFGLLKRAYTRQAIERLARESNFRQWEIRTEGIGFHLRLLKD
jgi:ubiquinone/menaquinone biosynthesis C-methylase UbiE